MVAVPAARHRIMRLPWLDNLRIMAGLAVVMLHVSGFTYRGYTGVVDESWMWGNLYNTGSRWCVPLFVMVSGYLLMKPGADQPAWDFLRRRLARIMPALVVWPLIYMTYTYLSFGRPENLRTALGSMVWRGDAFYHLWFVYMIAGLYLLTPLLRRWRDATSVPVQVAACSLMFILNLRLPGSGGAGLGRLLQSPVAPAVVTVAIPFLGYYLLGGLLAGGQSSRRPWLWAALFLAALALTITGVAWRVQASGSLEAAHILRVELAPGMVVMAVSLFQFFRGMPGVRLGGRWQARLAGSIFGIYLIHPLVIELFWRLGLHVDGWYSALGIPLTTLMVSGLSWGVTMGLQALPGTRRLV
jgi:surface polysaccharide O-acyltransferase-like enzyme